MIYEDIEYRLYPLLLQQEVKLPSVIYNPVSKFYDKGLIKHTGFVKQVVQFDIYGKSFKEVRELARQFINLLQDYKGDIKGVDVEAVNLVSDFPKDTNTKNSYDEEEFVWCLEFEFEYIEKE